MFARLLTACVVLIAGGASFFCCTLLGEEPPTATPAAEDSAGTTADPSVAEKVPALTSEETEFFEQHVRPLLVKRCYECHSTESKQVKGGLLLDSRQGWLVGGDSGPALIPGKPAESLLVKAIEYGEDVSQMPPAGKLPAAEIEVLKSWVQRGAPDPRLVGVGPKVRPKINIAAGRTYWAFQPVVESPLPEVQNQAWVQTPVDRFILAELESKGLQPAPPVDKRTLLRRVTFDLVGLPPTRDEVSAFLADQRPDAYARVVDRLLSSPHYGERWARHWLDLARYADSNGVDENVAYGNAWKYRDYVVRALNDDLPYDQFLTEQLAGDLLPRTEDTALWRRRMIATGFLALGPKVLAEPDKAKMEMDIVDEQIDTIGRAVLGLTLGCARCHDHKFDPLPTADYYALAGIFRSTRSLEERKGVVSRWYENVLLTPEEQKLFSGSAEEMPSALGVAERGQPQNLRVHIRGEHLNLGEEVPRGFPQVLSAEGELFALSQQFSGRLELAQWITRAGNPLTARVMANRVWRWHLGTGLVRTPDNFGELGERPTNGPLLDWLAVKFVEQGWSLKALHRVIVLSSTYQMSTAYNPAAAKVDPENRLYWRMNIHRLEADQIRDALLLTAGSLDRTLGGNLQLTKNREWVFDHTSTDGTQYNTNRRSLYLPVIRNHLYETFQLFDFPDPNFLSGDRATTTVAPQALFFMNNELVLDLTEQLAAELLADPGLGDDTERVQQLYERAYSRPASAAEIARGLAFLARCAELPVEAKLPAEAKPETKQQRDWQMLCQTILAASEFIYLR